MRIVSLLPSATEIICSMGLRDQLVGVTHECDYPAAVHQLPKVTRSLIPSDATSAEIDQAVRERLKSQAALYSLDMKVLERLSPDLIVTQALCDVCAVAESEVERAAAELPSYPRVINLEPNCLEDVFACIRQVGAAAGCDVKAEQTVRRLRDRVAAVDGRTRHLPQRLSVVLLEWIDPPFCAGHWSPELVGLAGGREALGEAGKRSATATWESIWEADPDVLMLACCGFDVPRTLADVPLLRKLPGWKKLQCVQDRRVYAVDGSAYFNRPGPRLVDSLEILAATLHPEEHPLPAGLQPATPVDV